MDAAKIALLKERVAEVVELAGDDPRAWHALLVGSRAAVVHRLMRPGPEDASTLEHLEALRDELEGHAKACVEETRTTDELRKAFEDARGRR
jgi:uncharacterized protein (DUF2342 family)